MYRIFLFIVCATLALAQLSPQRADPIQKALQDYQLARSEGRFEDAATKTEAARTLLAQTPVDSPQFAYNVQAVAQLYTVAKATVIVQQALDRVTASQDRIQLLGSLCGYARQEGNLLLAVAYQEKIVAAMDEEALKPPSKLPPPASENYPRFASYRSGFGYANNRAGAYQQLANLYQELGRPDSAEGVNKRMLPLLTNPNALASFYQQQGQCAEAIAIYKEQAAQADPSTRQQGLQMLSSLYQQQHRWDEAVDAQRALIAAQDAGGTSAQNPWSRHNLAAMLEQAGKHEDADQIYQDLLAQTRSADEGTYRALVIQYANYLMVNKRAADSQQLLSDYLTSHPNLPVSEEGSLLIQLGNATRAAGDGKRADEYIKAGQEKMAPAQHPVQNQNQISSILQAANTALQTNKQDEAFELALEAIASSPRATDRDALLWQIPNLARIFRASKKPERADQLWERMLTVIESWTDSSQSLALALQNYAPYLMERAGNRNEVPSVIKRYRELIIADHGTQSSALQEGYRLKMQFEHAQGAPQAAIATAQDMVAFVESLSGNTSAQYLRACDELARQYQGVGDHARALEMFRQNVAIADLAFRAADIQRIQVRSTAAWALADGKQFDEAERLAKEATAIANTMRPALGDQFTDLMNRIHDLKSAAHVAN